MLQDLHCVNSLDESEVRLVRLSMKQTAHVCTKRVRSTDTPRFLEEQLVMLQHTIAGVERRLAEVPIRRYGVTSESIDLGAMEAHLPQPADRRFMLFDRFKRIEDVNGLAGPRKQHPDFVPVDFLLVPEQVDSFAGALDALRHADKVCTLVSAQSSRIKNPAFYKVALLQHLFTKVLPLPRPMMPAKCI